MKPPTKPEKIDVNVNGCTLWFERNARADTWTVTAMLDDGNYDAPIRTVARLHRDRRIEMLVADFDIETVRIATEASAIYFNWR